MGEKVKKFKILKSNSNQNVRIQLEIQSNARTSDSSNATGPRTRETHLESIERQNSIGEATLRCETREKIPKSMGERKTGEDSDASNSVQCCTCTDRIST